MDGDLQHVDANSSESRFRFTGSEELENGMTVGVNMEFGAKYRAEAGIVDAEDGDNNGRSHVGVRHSSVNIGAEFGQADRRSGRDAHRRDALCQLHRHRVPGRRDELVLLREQRDGGLRRARLRPQGSSSGTTARRSARRRSPPRSRRERLLGRVDLDLGCRRRDRVRPPRRLRGQDRHERDDGGSPEGGGRFHEVTDRNATPRGRYELLETSADGESLRPNRGRGQPGTLTTSSPTSGGDEVEDPSTTFPYSG